MRSTLSELMPRIFLAAAIAMAVAACGGNDEEKRAKATAPLTANETVPGGIETAARKLLADELEVDEGDFKLDSSREMG